MTLRLVWLAVLVALAGTARAQPGGPDDDHGWYGAPQSAFHDTVVLLKRAIAERASRTAPVPTVTAGYGAGARTLAATYPPPRSDEAQQLFATQLANFSKVEQMLGVPAGDIGAAAAIFVISAYEAARETRVDPSAYKPVADQLRAAFARSPSFAKATPKQRRTAYEQLAILGMFLGVTRGGLAQKPNPSVQQRLRQAARDYLTQLALDPDTVQIDRDGVTHFSAAISASEKP